MSSRGGTAEDTSAVHLPHESSLDRKSADTAMRLVIQPTSLQQSIRPMNPDQASVQNPLKTGLLVRLTTSVAVCWFCDCFNLNGNLFGLG